MGEVRSMDMERKRKYIFYKRCYGSMMKRGVDESVADNSASRKYQAVSAHVHQELP